MVPALPVRMLRTAHHRLPKDMQTTLRLLDTVLLPRMPMEETTHTHIRSQDTPSKEPLMCRPRDMDKAKSGLPRPMATASLLAGNRILTTKVTRTLPDMAIRRPRRRRLSASTLLPSQGISWKTTFPRMYWIWLSFPCVVHPSRTTTRTAEAVSLPTPIHKIRHLN